MNSKALCFCKGNVLTQYFKVDTVKNDSDWHHYPLSVISDLISAMEKRKLEDLEKAIDFVKKNGFEAAMPEEMVKANKMLLSLKRLKRLKDEILNLKQSTVAEIRSYSKPPKAVHRVMIGTYLLLGNKEKSLQVIMGLFTNTC